MEAGDTGRHRVEAGDVIVHGPYERHLNRVSRRGAEVLVVPMATKWNRVVLGHVADPDDIAKIAERDMPAARAILMERMVDKKCSMGDWPDFLARDLIADPNLSLSDWAYNNGLHPGSLARGFGQQFEITPDSFRTVARARRALERIMSTDTTLSALASEEGFADQAHMSRTLKRLTGLTPQVLRKQLHARLQSA